MGIGYLCPFGLGRRGSILKNPFVVIVHRHRQRLLGVVLPDALKIKLPFNLSRLGDVYARPVFLCLGCQLLVQDLFAKDDAVVANVHPRTGDQLLDFGM